MKNAELVSQLIDGNFQITERSSPPSLKSQTFLSTAGFLKACKQAEIIAREGTNVVRLNILPPGATTARWKSPPSQKKPAQAILPKYASVEGEKLVIAFNVKFLRESPGNHHRSQHWYCK